VEGPFGLWTVEMTAAELQPHAELNFTRRYGASWEGGDHRVLLGHQNIEHALEHTV
jgi:hypothetical protein